MQSSPQAEKKTIHAMTISHQYRNNLSRHRWVLPAPGFRATPAGHRDASQKRLMGKIRGQTVGLALSNGEVRCPVTGTQGTIRSVHGKGGNARKSELVPCAPTPASLLRPLSSLRRRGLLHSPEGAIAAPQPNPTPSTPQQSTGDSITASTRSLPSTTPAPAPTCAAHRATVKAQNELDAEARADDRRLHGESAPGVAPAPHAQRTFGPRERALPGITTHTHRRRRAHPGASSSSHSS